jgi:hypothetical protein
LEEFGELAPPEGRVFCVDDGGALAEVVELAEGFGEVEAPAVA